MYSIHKILIACLLLAVSQANAQTGISVSPPRLYFELDAGQAGANTVKVVNVSASHTLDLSLSLGDWEYNENGDNVLYQADTLATSCASWVAIGPEDAYFSIKPGESKDVTINLNVPATLNNDISVHTAMLYITQMNPVDDFDAQGAKIQVSVQSGVKLYHRRAESQSKLLEIENLVFSKEGAPRLDLFFANGGNVWTDGLIHVDLLNTENGKTTSMEKIAFYTMPGDKRRTVIPLPTTLEKGSYVATVLIDYDENNMEIGELKFTYE